MKRDTLRETQHISRAGWGILPREPLAGDRIELGEHTERETGVLVPHDGEAACEFCNDETHVAERGAVPADYEVVAGDDEVLYHVCHCCFMDAPVVERGVRDFDADEVYTPKNEYEGPVDASLPEGQDGITHPHDRDG